MPDTPVPGWYPDPLGEAAARYWDGQEWTDQVYRTAQADVDTPRRVPPDAHGAGKQSHGPERVAIGVIAAIGIVGVLGVGAWLALDGSGGDEDAAAPPESSAAADTDGQDDASSTDEDEDPVERLGDDEDVPDMPTVTDVDDLDPSELDVLIAPRGEPVRVTLADGLGVTADGTTVRLDDRFVLRGDVTGDGRAELVLVLTLEDGTRPYPSAIAVIGGDESGPTPLEPPVFGHIGDGTPVASDVVVSGGTFRRTHVEALSVRDGAIEARVLVAPPSAEAFEVTNERVDPLSDNSRYEFRYERRADGAWAGTPDGPVTRMARTLLEERGFVPEAVLCQGRLTARGEHVRCSSGSTDGDVRLVSLLAVGDDGRFRPVVGEAPLVTTAVEVRAVLGNDDWFCRDIATAAEQGPDRWEPPMAAISYWFDEGQPTRMDASNNGIPCQTVFDEVATFLIGGDGSLTDAYQVDAAR